MSATIKIEGDTKENRYESLIVQIKSLIENEKDIYAALGNMMSALKYGMDFFWVGLYMVKNNELVLGPFQGTVACAHIGYGKGVCGTAWKTRKTIIVDDVNSFVGHIACSTDSKSEIVLPVFNKDNEVAMVLDIDSEYPAYFNSTDENCLSKIVSLIESVVN